MHAGWRLTQGPRLGQEKGGASQGAAMQFAVLARAYSAAANPKGVRP